MSSFGTTVKSWSPEGGMVSRDVTSKESSASAPRPTSASKPSASRTSAAPKPGATSAATGTPQVNYTPGTAPAGGRQTTAGPPSSADHARRAEMLRRRTDLQSQRRQFQAGENTGQPGPQPVPTSMDIAQQSGNTAGNRASIIEASQGPQLQPAAVNQPLLTDPTTGTTGAIGPDQTSEEYMNEWRNARGAQREGQPSTVDQAIETADRLGDTSQPQQGQQPPPDQQAPPAQPGTPEAQEQANKMWETMMADREEQLQGSMKDIQQYGALQQRRASEINAAMGRGVGGGFGSGQAQVQLGTQAQMLGAQRSAQQDLNQMQMQRMEQLEQRGMQQAGFGEAEKTRAWQSSERVDSQAFEAGETDALQKWKSGERLSSEEFTALESALNRTNQSEMAKDLRTWQTSEREGSQEFQSGERQAVERFQTGERLSTQEFAMNRDVLQSNLQERREDLQRRWQSGEAVSEREFQDIQRQESQFFQMDMQQAGFDENEAQRLWQSQENQAQEDWNTWNQNQGRQLQTDLANAGFADAAEARSHDERQNILNRDLQEALQKGDHAEAQRIRDFQGQMQEDSQAYEQDRDARLQQFDLTSLEERTNAQEYLMTAQNETERENMLFDIVGQAASSGEFSGEELEDLFNMLSGEDDGGDEGGGGDEEFSGRFMDVRDEASARGTEAAAGIESSSGRAVTEEEADRAGRGLADRASGVASRIGSWFGVGGSDQDRERRRDRGRGGVGTRTSRPELDADGNPKG